MNKSIIISIIILALTGCGQQPQSQTGSQQSNIASNIPEVTTTNFQAQVLDSNMPVLVDFYANWCGPCQRMAPTVDSVAAKYKGKLKVVRVNIDNSPELAQRYRVEAIPKLLLFKNGDIAADMIGATDGQQLSSSLERSL